MRHLDSPNIHPKLLFFKYPAPFFSEKGDIIPPCNCPAERYPAACPAHFTDEIFGNAPGGTGILPGDQIAVCDNMGTPVGPGTKECAQFFQTVFKQKRQYAVITGLPFFRIGDSGDFFSVDHRITVIPPGFQKRRYAVTDGPHRLAAFKKRGSDPCVPVI